mmetsp:Transcript_7582/g.23064  ORF Transcript_7582/g.23064 Transcript_7582/m.23064 type:complete len:208 (-) Transcript_7582:253-876(-)
MEGPEFLGLPAASDLTLKAMYPLIFSWVQRSARTGTRTVCPGRSDSTPGALSMNSAASLDAIQGKFCAAQPSSLCIAQQVSHSGARAGARFRSSEGPERLLASSKRLMSSTMHACRRPLTLLGLRPMFLRLVGPVISKTEMSGHCQPVLWASTASRPRSATQMASLLRAPWYSACHSQRLARNPTLLLSLLSKTARAQSRSIVSWTV